MATLDTNFSKITTLKKQDGTVLYPRTVTEAVVDGEGKSLTEIISNLTVAKNDQITLIGAVKDKVINLEAAMQSKVDKEEGKVLSTNDFTDELKAKLESLEPTNDIISLLDYKVDKVDGKDLSTNDFTDSLKAKLTELPTREEIRQMIADGNTGTGGSISCDCGFTEDLKAKLTELPTRAEILEMIGNGNTGEGGSISCDCGFTEDLKAKLNELPTRAELEELLKVKVESEEGEVEEVKIVEVVTNNVERIETLDNTVVQNVTVEENKIVFSTRNNTVVNELDFVTEEDSNSILDSIFEK